MHILLFDPQAQFWNDWEKKEREILVILQPTTNWRAIGKDM